ncbi:oligopeptidase B [Neomicrococcus aestuarii]|uniref:Oligopeptidase B n=1 Tax=Neomicrococcus aestuarii TaxID=556325 RepID=A0A7W8TUZ4_9MICC|nr:S9 family peptidase [Neomicrococcus aestuarii]MBB5513371.1 oligopeptidase B [Neomicrococcus aestuarii]
MNESDSVPVKPPVARKEPTYRTHHGDTFVDDYEWLRNKESAEVLEHLAAENKHVRELTQHQQPTRDAIFQEIKQRTQETDKSVPSRIGDWWYFTRTSEGQQYAKYCRVPAQNTGDEHADWTPPEIPTDAVLDGEVVLLDGNKEKEGQPFFSLGAMAFAEDGSLFAYAVDNAGDERFTVRFMDPVTLSHYDDVIPGAFYDLALAPANDRVFYTVVDDTWRPFQIRQHVLGTPVEQDTVVFEENDASMWLGFDLSADRTEMVIQAGNSEYAETWVMDLVDPGAQPRLLVSRDERVLHGIDPVQIGDQRYYLLVHNRQAPNNELAIAAASEFEKPYADQQWLTLIKHRETVKLSGSAVNRRYLILSLRENTTERVQFLSLAHVAEFIASNATASADSATAPAPADSAEPLNTAADSADLSGVVVQPQFDEELCSVWFSDAPYDSPFVRLSYTSFFTPAQIFDFDASQQQLELRKETVVPGGYDSSQYVATREWADAADGTKIPLSVLRRADVTADGTNPTLVYGYGSYEASMDPQFTVPRLSVLDRGVVFVIAHIRGGGELGRSWYEQGKKLQKKNTFTDFVDATRWLIAHGWADPKRVAAMGGSAGGLLIGAVANLAPELYKVIVAQVPFVDALTTILDPELPLSALEWEEWGNPITDPEVYAYMKSYTPYENIRAVEYPRIAAVTSLNDTRVLYVEPAKWVAKLREVTTGSEPIFLKTEIDGGHGGASGRYEKWKDIAWDYAFILDGLEVSQ